MTDAPPPYPGINGYSATAPYMGAGGFVNPPTSGGSGNSMGASVLQTGYVDPNNPQMAYLPTQVLISGIFMLNLKLNFVDHFIYLFS